jgi:hypothetical protein
MRHNTTEYSLIAAALTGNSWVPGPPWDWDKTVEIAAREEVLPALHGKLSCPPEVSDFFEAIHELNVERNRELLSEVETLALLLNQAGIEPVLLKGAAYLVTGVYSDPAERYLTDIDFLVRPPQSAQAFEIIRRSGYERSHVQHPVELVHHHHPVLTQIGRIPVEVHHNPCFGPASSVLTTDEIVNSATLFRLGRAVVRIPSAEHLMTHLILHSQLQHGAYYRIWPSLRAMLDLILVGRRFTVDWGAIRDRFRLHGKDATLNLHLMQVEKALGIPPPFPVSVGAIRWWHRRVLWREPTLRYIDPFYVTSRMILPRISLSWRLLKHPISRKYVLTIPFRRSFYRNLLNDIANY